MKRMIYQENVESLNSNEVYNPKPALIKIKFAGSAIRVNPKDGKFAIRPTKMGRFFVFTDKARVLFISTFLGNR